MIEEKKDEEIKEAFFEVLNTPSLLPEGIVSCRSLPSSHPRIEIVFDSKAPVHPELGIPVRIIDENLDE